MKLRTRENPFSDSLQLALLTALGKAAKELDAMGLPFVVIGGVALSYRFPPIHTQDVDLAVESEDKVPDRIDGLKRVMPHGFEDRSGVLVEILTAQYVRVPQAVFDFAFKTATLDTTLGYPIRVASRLGLFALKICAGRDKPRHKDMAHMIWMMRHGFMPTTVHLAKAGVPADRLYLLAEAKRAFRQEQSEEKEMGW